MRLPRSHNYRIGIVLSTIAVVPLAGSTVAAVRDVVAARSEQAQVAEIHTTVRDVIDLSELRIMLLEERNWTAAELGMEQLGLDTETVNDLTGVDVPVSLNAAAHRVDELVEELGLTATSERIADVRSQTSLNMYDQGLLYEEVEAEVARVAQTRSDQLVEVVGHVTNRGNLITELEILNSATIARRAVAAEFSHFFSMQFSNAADPVAETTLLISNATTRRAEMENIERLAAPGSATRAAIDQIVSSTPAQSFDATIDRQVAQAVSGELGKGSLISVLGRFDEVVAALEQTRHTTSLFVDLVDAAAFDMLSSSAATSDLAAARNQQAILMLSVLTAASLLTVLAAARVIVLPIHALAQSARRVRDGEADPGPTTITGPSEIREAARAIDEAEAQLALAERQALALAQGQLDHPSLREPGSGALGASLQRAVRTLADSLHEREEFRKRVAHEATHDGLTGLANRSASLDALGRSLSRAGETSALLAVFFIDLDGFKQVNDQIGHHAGDTVLRATAERLVKAVRDRDLVGRIGGDEFVVVAEPVLDEQDAVDIAERILEAVSVPIEVDGQLAGIGASIGVALSAEEPMSSASLLRDADMAVYRAKELGRGQIIVCDHDLRAALADRASFDKALRSALSNDEFVLHYQAIVDSADKEVVSYEALVRWDRPGEGMVSPDDFVPFAENNELIVSIDRWVLERVAYQLAAWSTDPEGPRQPVAVNVSARHVASPNFINDVLGPLAAHGVPYDRLVIEITESALFDDLAMAGAKLRQLRDAGIRIAIDDFGTGFTSLAHLRSLPIDILKIDRSFVAEDPRSSLIQLIISTGHLLGAEVTAEGIETPDQAAALWELGTDNLQGYLYSRPVPASQVLVRGITSEAAWAGRDVPDRSWGAAPSRPG